MNTSDIDHAREEIAQRVDFLHRVISQDRRVMECVNLETTRFAAAVYYWLQNPDSADAQAACYEAYDRFLSRHAGGFTPVSSPHDGAFTPVVEPA